MSIEKAIASLGSHAAKFALPLEREMIAGGIVSSLEKAHFIAQMVHESGNFSRTDENLNYSLERLLVVFKKYFPTRTLALLYARQPAKIANRVYANRYGNGNEASGDGYRYRGRGPTQLTFKGNYAEASQDIYGDDRLVKNPDMVADPEIGAKTAVWYWNSRGCCAPSRRDDVAAVTQKINGGDNGLEDRIELVAKMKILFKV